jgi:LPXTG-motif cell wall-anchored protein
MQRRLPKTGRHAAIFILAGGFLISLAGYFLALPVMATKEYKGNCSLTGVVLGPDDKPVPRAVITYQSSSGNWPHAVHTDSQGNFAIRHLRADNYDMRASANGIFSEWEKNISLRAGESKSLTLRLIYTRQPVKPKPGKKSKQPS